MCRVNKRKYVLTVHIANVRFKDNVLEVFLRQVLFNCINFKFKLEIFGRKL